MNRTTRLRLAIIFFIGCMPCIGIAAYKAYAALFDHVVEKSEAWHLRVEEVKGTSPLELKITIDPNQGWAVIRRVSVKSHGSELTLLYHVGLSGKAPPAVIWGKPYTLTVPDSVSEVRFGHRSETIWVRSNPAK
jgi:hypothetical protein